MREKILNFIGLGLLLVCFMASITRIALSKPKASPEGKERVTIRFAHWQLENGPRDALDQIAAEYMKLHPHVEVKQIAIPERIYINWLITQLVGETAPDLIQISPNTNDERLARYFTPLSRLAAQPNPYNEGTQLAGVPLRDTLFDGMEGGFNNGLSEFYGVPISGFTIRIFYNLDLIREITGEEKIPQTYEELLSLCQKVTEWSGKKGKPIVPIASSKYNGPILMNNLYSSQTQRLAARNNPTGVLQTNAIINAASFTAGKWSLDSPEIRSGYELIREISQYMQPGFLQVQRDEASLLFVQGRAAMICSGSWDVTSIRRQAGFRLSIGAIPFPSREHPKYGEYTLGVLSEAGSNGGVAFGLPRQSPHPEIAEDFLLFLASHPMNQLWTETSGWLPSVIHTQVSEEVAPFLPRTEGELPGMTPTLTTTGIAFPDLTRLYTTNLYQLVKPTGSAEDFIEDLKPHYRRAITADLRRELRKSLDIVRANDTQLAALAWLAESPGSTPSDAHRLEELLQSMALNSRKYYQTEMALQNGD